MSVVKVQEGEDPGVQDDATDEELDLVRNPPHYTSHPSGIECIDVAKHMSFLSGQRRQVRLAG